MRSHPNGYARHGIYIVLAQGISWFDMFEFEAASASTVHSFLTLMQPSGASIVLCPSVFVRSKVSVYGSLSDIFLRGSLPIVHSTGA